MSGPKINLGCGNDIRSGYINVDCRATSPSVVVADVLHLPAYLVGAEEILAIDVLEHLSHLDTVKALSHWRSRLVDGGRLIVQGPCLKLICRKALAATSTKEIADAIRRLFGRQDYPANTHRTSLDQDLLREQAQQAGFGGKMEFRSGGFGNGTNLQMTAWK